MGLRCAQNFVVRPYGGVARRAGLSYLGLSLDNASRSRLIDFRVSASVAYVLEFNELQVRVWRDRALVPGATLASPYPAAVLRTLRYAQSADVMYLCHPDYPVYKLARTTPTTFVLGPVTWDAPPTTELGIQPATGLTLSALTGTGVTVTAGAATWLAGDVGRHIRSGLGVGVITAVGSGTAATLDVIDPFAATTVAAGAWTLEDSPQLTMEITTAGAVVTLTSQGAVAGVHAEEMTGYVRIRGGVVALTGGTSTTLTGRLLAPFAPPLPTPPPTPTSPPGAWSIEQPAWSATRGYPGTVAFNQARLWLGGTHADPDTVWGSAVGDYEMFALGANDDNAVEYPLAVSSGMNRIRWIKGMAAGSTTGLAVGTLAAEISLEGGQEAPLTPSNVRARERTYYGSDYDVDALQTNNLVLFLQRGSRRIREFTYALEQDSFVAPDLTLTAEHLTRSGVVEMVHANSPDSLIFALTSDGTLLSCAYERPESVVAWTHHTTQGWFESVCVIPNSCGTADEVWVEVLRPTGYRSIEVFDGRLNTDAALVYSGTATGTFTGLTHLIGAAVKALDQAGTVYDLIVDATGAITLPGGASATALEVGLHYTSTLETLRPEVGSPQGTIQGRRKHWAYTVARLYCTRGRLLWNGQFLLERPEGIAPGVDYTGDSARFTSAGWNRDGRITLQTLDPKSVTILGLTGALLVDDP